MKLNTIVFDSVEQAFAISGMALAAQNYAAVNMGDREGDVIPFFASVLPNSSGSNAGKTFLRLSGNIELNPDVLYTGKLAKAVIEVNEADALADRYYEGFSTEGGSSSSNTIYDVAEFGLALAFAPEKVVWSSSKALHDLEDFSGNGITTDASDFDLVPGLIDGNLAFVPTIFQSGSAYDFDNPTASSVDFTLVFSGLIGDTSSFGDFLEGDNYEVKVMPNQIRLIMNGSSHDLALPTHDGKIHVWVLDVSSSDISLYQDGVLAANLAHSQNTTGNSWTSVLHSMGEAIYLSDICLKQGRLNTSEINALSNKIALQRNITVQAIS